MHCLIQRGTPTIWYAHIFSHWREKFLVKFKGCIWNYQTTNPFQRWHPVLSQMLQDPLSPGSCWIMSTQTKPISNHVIVPPCSPETWHAPNETGHGMTPAIFSHCVHGCPRFRRRIHGDSHGRSVEQGGFRRVPVSSPWHWPVAKWIPTWPRFQCQVGHTCRVAVWKYLKSQWLHG